MIGTTFLNLSNADAASKSQKPHFTSRQSCGGYRVKKLGASPSARPLRRLAAAPPLPASQAPRIARVQQECNRPQTQRRRKRRRENANEIPLTPLNTIPLPPSPAHGSHTANTLQICNERGGFPNDGVLARRPASRQRKCAVSRREPRAIGSRRVFCGPAGLEPPR